MNWGLPLAGGRLLNTQSQQTVSFGSSEPEADPVFTTWATALGTVADIKINEAQYLVDEIGFGPDGYYGHHFGNGKAPFTGFDATVTPGHAIAKVEVVLPLFINQAFSKDFKVKTYVAGHKQGEVKVKTEMFYSAIGAANANLMYLDITATNDWTWDDFYNDLQLVLETGGLGGDRAIYYDAVGLRVTSTPGMDDSADNLVSTSPQSKAAIDTSKLVNAFPAAGTGAGSLEWDTGPSARARNDHCSG